MMFGGPRKLKLTHSGRWFVGLTILLGLVAIMARNNVFYLLESFLLGTMILSGVLSEITIATADIRWKRRPAAAGEKPSDQLKIINRSRIPYFCLEVGEWKENKFHTRAFIPFLPAKGQVTVEADFPYTQRGVFNWDGMAFATRFPFGFAQKLRWTKEPGTRVIWPARGTWQNPNKARNDQEKPKLATRSEQRSGSPVGKRGVGHFAEGEIREYVTGDDFRDVVWTLSASRGSPMVRVRRNHGSNHELSIDLRTEAGQAFEDRVSDLAECFYRGLPHLASADAMDDTKLHVIGWKEKKTVRGTRNCLEVLAILQAEGSQAPLKKAAS